VENVRHVAALARRVMEKTPHVLIAGEGARMFALKQGFPLECLSTPESLAAWYKRRDEAKKGHARLPSVPSTEPTLLALEEMPFGHDTVTVLALDQSGSLAGACSTSGMGNKLPGRVGDSPIIGAALYVDNDGGAAGATGDGEEVIRAGGSLLIVEAMRSGKSAQEACEAAAKHVIAVAGRRGVHPGRVAFLSLDRHGQPGAACTERTNFQYAIGRPGKVELLKAREVAS
jgi:isoaspartyl peptidase/L-asparaginase-like protein (Ntn-hydrolase superfamily)